MIYFTYCDMAPIGFRTYTCFYRVKIENDMTMAYKYSISNLPTLIVLLFQKYNIRHLSMYQHVP